MSSSLLAIYIGVFTAVFLSNFLLLLSVSALFGYGFKTPRILQGALVMTIASSVGLVAVSFGTFVYKHYGSDYEPAPVVSGAVFWALLGGMVALGVLKQWFVRIATRDSSIRINCVWSSLIITVGVLVINAVFGWLICASI